MSQEIAEPVRLMPRILFAAFVLIWLLSTVSKMGSIAGFWQQYYAKDIALLSDTAMTAQDADLTYTLVRNDAKLLVTFRQYELLTTSGISPVMHPRASDSTIDEIESIVSPPKIHMLKTPSEFIVNSQEQTTCGKVQIRNATFYLNDDGTSTAQGVMRGVTALMRAGWYTTDEEWTAHTTNDISEADFILIIKEGTSETVTSGPGPMSKSLECNLAIPEGSEYFQGIEKTQGVIITVQAGNDVSSEIWEAMQKTYR